MRTKIFYLFFLIIIFLASCDTDNYIHYIVENNTNDSVSIKYTFVDNFMFDHPVDSIVMLKSYQLDTIFTFIQISPSVYNPENGDKMNFIKNVQIIRLSDKVLIKKDMILRENWNYSETGKHSAVMKFVINNIDF